MEKTISIEDIEKVVKAVLKVWEAIKEVVKKFVRSITNLVKNCKALRRACMRLYYSCQAEGKSNNWRKYHGLKTIRR